VARVFIDGIKIQENYEDRENKTFFVSKRISQQEKTAKSRYCY
jgi:hypothetical protein